MKKRIRPEILGLIGTVAIVLTILGAIRFESLPLVNNGATYTAAFAEVGGLREGDSVQIAGARVGAVQSIELDGAEVRVRFTVDDDIRLGESTSARIGTVTLLGQAALEIVPAGQGELAEGVIPLDRTAAPYNVSSTLSDLTSEAAAIDVDGVAQALDEVATTFSGTPPYLRKAVGGVGRLAQTISANDDVLRRLLSRASRASEVLANRNSDVAQLLVSGSDLLGELTARRDVLVSLLDQVTRLSHSIRPLLRVNERPLARTLSALDDVARRLNRNRVALQAAIDGIRNYAIGFGEAVSTGPFFDAYVQNLTAPASLAPFISGVDR